jgi:hypothetical protein
MVDSVDAGVLKRIKNEAVRRLSSKRREATNLYAMEEVQSVGSVLRARHQEISITRPTVAVFVDEEPLANWSHDCKYLLHDAESGELYEEVRASFPPYLVNPPKTFRAFHTPVVAWTPERRIWPIEPPIVYWKIPKGRRYAILYSGASNNRHVNDMEFLYRQLVDRFFFREADITVLNYDGTLNYSGNPKPVANYPGDGTAYQMSIDGPGTRQALLDAIDALKSSLKQDDLLFIHTNNHGGHDGSESYLCTYSGADCLASDFCAKLAQLPTYGDLVVMMEQCHSGGFNDGVIENSTAARTTFSAACTEGKNSIGGPEFDPFARDWISALAGADPYGAALVANPDYDASGKVSAREAFAYADDVHHPYDSPVYSAYGADAGNQHLHQKWRSLFVVHELLASEIELVRRELREPERFRETMRSKILPKLAELDDELAFKPQKPDAIAKLVRETVRAGTREHV